MRLARNRRATFFGLIMTALLVLALEAVGRFAEDVSISGNPPPGFVRSPHSDTSSDGIDYVFFPHADNQAGGVSVEIHNYPSVIVERMLSIRLVPPGDLLDVDRGRARSRVAGIGIGTDRIQCNAYNGNSCQEWVYWSHNGTRLITVEYLRDDTTSLSEEEFRSLVRQLLEV